MTLYEYLKEHKEDEITVLDNNYDCETYWYWVDPKDIDEWDQALMKIAMSLNVKRITRHGKAICNLSELIEYNLSELMDAGMFYRDDMEYIMYDIDSIFSGYVSEEWMSEFARIICHK